MDDTDDELKDRVFRLTFEEMVADHADSIGAGPAAALWGGPQRFVSTAAVDRVRTLIERACSDAQADSQVAEYFTTHWLQRFAPRLV